MPARSLQDEIEGLSEDLDEFLERPGKKGPAAGRSPDRRSVPPMIEMSFDDDGEALVERYTADVKEAAAAAIRATEGMAPRRLFEVLHERLGRCFRDELRLRDEFLRVKYFVPSPPEMQATFGPYCPIYNEPFGATAWDDLHEVIWKEAVRREEESDHGPRGIHFVHEPRVWSGDGGQVDGLPDFSLDVSLDGRGTIEDRATHVELWWNLAMYHDGDAEHADQGLVYAAHLTNSYLESLEAVAELMGCPIAPESSLCEFFSLVDAGRLSNLALHDLEIDALPAGQPYWEFNARAGFDGREMRISLDDSTGFLLARARDLHEASQVYGMPLRHFALGIMGHLNTVTFERRWEPGST